MRNVPSIAGIRVCCYVTTAITSLATADTLVVISENGMDLTRDMIPEYIVAAPFGYGNNVPSGAAGIVSIYSADAVEGELIVTFVGAHSDDSLGATSSFVDDLNNDGHQDLLLGAPGINSVYLVEGPFANPCSPIITIDQAASQLVAPHDDLFNFGFEVAPMYDFNDDGYVDFRVAGKYIDNGEQIRTRTYIYSGITLRPIALIEPVNAMESIASISADTDNDAIVDEEDLETVIVNLGNPNPKGKWEGDIDESGMVDGIDLMDALINQGASSYVLSNTVPPDSFVCEPLDGCKSFSAQDENGEWMCVSWMNCHQWYIETSEVDDELQFLLQEMPIEDLPTVDSYEDALQWKKDCQAEIDLCLSTPNGYPYFTPVVDAMFRLMECLGLDFDDDILLNSFIRSILIIEFKQCNGGEAHVVTPICDEGVSRTITMALCCPLNYCEFLAHELNHVAQLCELGLFDKDVTCEDFLYRYDNQWNILCMEYEAHVLSGICEFPHQDGDGSIGIQNCCLHTCNSAHQHWTDCQFDCVNCCIALSESCCIDGQFVCDVPTENCNP